MTVSLWERVKGAFSREAEEVKVDLKSFGENLDRALAKKEQELAASPAERFDMMLEHADASNQRLEDLVAEADADGDANDAADATISPATGPGVTSATDPSLHDPASHVRQPGARHQLLDPDDVSTSPLLADTLEWVIVEPTQDADPMCSRCGHAAWIDEEALPFLGGQELQRVAQRVEEHPLVDDVVLEEQEVLYVGAPSLHHEDVRLLVAAAMTEQLPDGWQNAAPPPLSV